MNHLAISHVRRRGDRLGLRIDLGVVIQQSPDIFELRTRCLVGQVLEQLLAAMEESISAVTYVIGLNQFVSLVYESCSEFFYWSNLNFAVDIVLGRSFAFRIVCNVSTGYQDSLMRLWKSTHIDQY